MNIKDLYKSKPGHISIHTHTGAHNGVTRLHITSVRMSYWSPIALSIFEFSTSIIWLKMMIMTPGIKFLNKTFHMHLIQIKWWHSRTYACGNSYDIKFFLFFFMEYPCCIAPCCFQWVCIDPVRSCYCHSSITYNSSLSPLHSTSDGLGPTY